MQLLYNCQYSSNLMFSWASFLWMLSFLFLCYLGENHTWKNLQPNLFSLFRMIEQVGNLMGGLTSGTGTGKTNNTANNPPNDTIYLCNFRHTFFPNFFLINHRKFYKVTCKWGKETIKKESLYPKDRYTYHPF